MRHNIAPHLTFFGKLMRITRKAGDGTKASPKDSSATSHDVPTESFCSRKNQYLRAISSSAKTNHFLTFEWHPQFTINRWRNLQSEIAAHKQCQALEEDLWGSFRTQ